MLNRILTGWHIRNRRFAHALAAVGVPRDRDGNWMLWGHYQLGMYDTVAKTELKDADVQSLIAKGVAFSARGQKAEADASIMEFLRQPHSASDRQYFASALAPYSPDVAFRLLEYIEVPESLRTALLLRSGQVDRARQVLSQAFERGLAQSCPELHLFRSNVLSGNPREQLRSLNAFLEAHAVPPVALIDDEEPLSPRNLKSADPVRPVEGPLVSVLMTTYESGQWVETAIRSVLGQSYRTIELIVIDDASQDETLQIVKACAKRDARVKYLRMRRNAGTYVAKAIGLGHARGEFVTCHDSDDWSHPLKIERQMKPLLSDRKLVASTSHWLRVQDDGVYHARAVHPLLRMNVSSTLFRRNVVLSCAGAWDPVRTGADSEFLARLRLVFGRAAIHRVAQPLSLGSHRPGSLMTSLDTGYSETGLAPQRLAYWEAWSRWHIDSLRRHRRPYLASDIESIAKYRPFAIPPEVQVSASEVVECLANVDVG